MIRVWQKIVQIVSFTLLWGGVCAPFGVARPEIELSFSPALSQLSPGHDPVQVTMRLVAEDGALMGPTKFHLRIRTPESNPFVSTDFPVVENTLLLDQDFATNSGESIFRLVLPIRGTYQFQVTAQPEAVGTAGQTVAASLNVSLAENSIKMRNAALFLLVLVGLGAWAGMALGREAKVQRIRAVGAVGLIVLGVVTMPFFSQSAFAHGPHHKEVPQQQESTASAAGPTILLATPTPRVGDLTSLRVIWPEDAADVEKAASYKLEIMRLEDGLNVVEAVVTPANGEATWQSQLFDGTDYEARVRKIAPPLGRREDFPLATLTFAVEPVEPPIEAVIKSLGLMLGVFTMAMLVTLVITAYRKSIHLGGATL